MAASIFLYIVLALAAVIYYFLNKVKKYFSYFKNRGIPQLQTELFYGDARDMIQEKLFHADFYLDAYNKFKKMGVDHGGVYLGKQKVWVPISPELVKTILTKDFSYFSAHYVNVGHTIMFQNIFLMDGEEWKDMRKKLTPTFTSGKMKMMYNMILEKSIGLIDLVDKKNKSGEPVEMKEVLARYTTDIIGTCGFGIECNSIEDPDSEFFKQGQNMLTESDEKAKNAKVSLFHMILMYFAPPRRRTQALNNLESFFRNVVRDTIDFREKNKVVRKDFLHLMIQLKNKGAVTDLANDDEDIYEKTVKEEVLTLDQLAGQCMLFFNAGFETSSTTMSYALLELTQNQDVQQKLRTEIREVLKRHNGNLTYDALQEMTYCGNVVNETLRKYPAVPTLPRTCTKTYKIPGTESIIEKSSLVSIPILGIHMDPDHHPNPHKFDPDRFAPENKAKIKDFTYLPFGEGPRMCLGLRFGIMQSKAGLASLINNYNFTLNKKTPFPPKYRYSQGIIGQVDGGVWVNVTKVI